jgi:hypothetical protein
MHKDSFFTRATMQARRPTLATHRSVHAVTIAMLIGVAAALLALPACTEAPSWQTLLSAKIRQQYPGYDVQPQPDGSVIVRRPGQADAPVDVNAIGAFCRRGPKDCNYATDQMLLELGAAKKQEK